MVWACVLDAHRWAGAQHGGDGPAYPLSHCHPSLPEAEVLCGDCSGACMGLSGGAVRGAPTPELAVPLAALGLEMHWFWLVSLQLLPARFQRFEGLLL